MAKRGTLTHRKTRRLARALGGIPLPYALGVMESLWHATQTHTPDGAIGRLSDDDIAEEMWWDGDPAQLVAALVESGFVDEHPEHRLVVHGWCEHADAPTHMSLARKRQFFASGEAPSLNRLPHAERQSAAEFYQSEAENESVRTEGRSVRTKPESVRTEAHGKRTASRIPSPPLNKKNPPTPQAGGQPPDGGGVVGASVQEPDHQATPEEIAKAEEQINQALGRNGMGGIYLGQGQLKSIPAACLPLAEDWKERLGGVPDARQLSRAMLPLIEDHGFAEVQERWRRYLDATEPRYASPTAFASKFGRWSGAPPGAGKCHLRTVDEIKAEEREKYLADVAKLPPEIREIELHGTPEQKAELARKIIAGEIEL